MELGYNFRPRFTEWVVANKLLQSRFVLLDIGVQGGIHPRWNHLGAALEVHGFDALAETVAPLAAAAPPRHHYYSMALGNEDGHTTLFVPANKFAASLALRDLAPEHRRLRIDPGVSASPQPRTVPVARLDTLLRNGLIPPPDFLKMDCEGHEPAILRGAAELLAGRSLIGIQSEIGLLPSGARQSHFSDVFEQLRPHGFAVTDVVADRFACRSFADRAVALDRRRAISGLAGAVGALEMLFVAVPAAADRLTADRLLKCAIVLELFGFNDMAYDVLIAGADRVAGAADIAPAADRLIYRPSIARSDSSISRALGDLGRALIRSMHYRFDRRLAPGPPFAD